MRAVDYQNQRSINAAWNFIESAPAIDPGRVMWRWTSASVLIVVGLVIGMSAAGAQDACGGTFEAAVPAALFHTDPGHSVTQLEPRAQGGSGAARELTRGTVGRRRWARERWLWRWLSQSR